MVYEIIEKAAFSKEKTRERSYSGEGLSGAFPFRE
jgi:hypothetical protein